MFGGFDPKDDKHEFLERRRGVSIGLAVGIYAAVIVGMMYMPKPEPVEEEPVEVQLAPQPEPEEEPPEDLEIEEEPEEEPPPPPPPNAKPRPQNSKPKPAPEVETPQEISDEELSESDEAKKDQAGDGYGTGDPNKSGTGTKPEAKPVAEEKPEPKPEKAPPKRDPTKPTTLTREDKPAKPDPGNRAPEYPKPMQSRGIEGQVVVKYEVDHKARLRKIKFIRVTNNATKASIQEKANDAMKKAVAKAMSTWKFLEPCRHPDGKPFTCVMRKSFPFKLKK